MAPSKKREWKVTQVESFYCLEVKSKRGVLVSFGLLNTENSSAFSAL